MRIASAFSLKEEPNIRLFVETVKPKTQTPPLDDLKEIKRIDKSGMLQFSVEAAKHYGEAGRIGEKIVVDYPKPENVIVAGMGGSGIGGELLRDYARTQAPIPIEVSKDYTLPAYAGKRSLVVVVSYSGDTEESLSAFLDALKRHCMVYCISSGGALLEQAEKLNVPFLRVPAGMPPRAASPYLLVPQLMLMQKIGLVSGLPKDLEEAIQILEKVCHENAPEKATETNLAKMLASGINGTMPVVYGFGIYRGVAMRWKQQFNENAKVPAKWEVFPELDHNEVVGWEKADALASSLSTVFLRDKSEPAEVRSRIEITKSLMPKASKQFEIWAQGKGTLAKMFAVMIVGDFTSVYLAVLRNVDPTPVPTIVTLKKKLGETGTKERIIRELEKLKPLHS
jgi:glucose/mannose-6-phosphate isomerase